MNYAIASILAISALCLIIPGILIKYKKAYGLIAGYNTLSGDKKKNVDIERLSRLVGNSCFVMAAAILLGGLLLLAGKPVIAGAVFALIFPFSFYLVVKARMYDGNSRNADGSMNTKSRIITAVAGTVLIAVLFGFGSLMYYTIKAPVCEVSAGYLNIKGMYGQEFRLGDIRTVKLVDHIPGIAYKSNGSAMGNSYKGHFRLETIGEATLYLDASKPPFIYIDRISAKPVILNCSTPEETRGLYEKLTEE